MPPPSCDEEKGGWEELGAMPASRFFGSQVSLVRRG